MIISIGCGKKRPSTAPVSGKVTYQGKPVPQGRIIFFPESGRPAVGVIGPDGLYRLTTFPDNPGDGAVPGKYRVTVDAVRVEGTEQKTFSLQDELRGQDFATTPPQVVRLVPEKYARTDTSNLSAEVKAGPNVIDFDLP